MESGKIVEFCFSLILAPKLTLSQFRHGLSNLMKIWSNLTFNFSLEAKAIALPLAANCEILRLLSFGSNVTPVAFGI